MSEPNNKPLNPVPETQKSEKKYPLLGCITLVLAIICFSGIFSSAKGGVSALDYLVVTGKFGVMKAATATYRGMGGDGVKDGFMMALGLIPSVAFAMGLVNIVEECGGLKVAQRLLTPILRPLLGLPGIASLALISSAQSSDAGAGMTKGLFDQGLITEKERIIFAQFQITGAAFINNFLALGAVIFADILVPIFIPFAMILILKIFAANVTRVVLNRFYKEVK